MCHYGRLKWDPLDSSYVGAEGPHLDARVVFRPQFTNLGLGTVASHVQCVLVEELLRLYNPLNGLEGAYMVIGAFHHCLREVSFQRDGFALCSA